MNDEMWNELIKKIRLQRGLHRCYELQTRYVSTVIRIVNIVLPAHIIFLAFSDIASLSKYISWLTPMNVELTIGVSGFALFVVNILTEVYKGDLKHVEHRKAIERYSELLQEINISDSPQGHVGKSARMRSETFENFNKRYLQITVTSPTFTDKQFERGMVYLLKSKAIKSARKEQPFARFWQVRKIAKGKVAEIIDDETDPLYGVPFTRKNLRGQHADQIVEESTTTPTDRS